MAAKPIFQFDAKALLAKIDGGKTTLEYSDKRVVFAQGETADSVFYIQKGNVKLTVVSHRGREAVVAILNHGNFFGEGCLAGQPLRMSTATVLGEATIIRITKQAMIRLLHSEPEFAEVFIVHLVSRNSRLEEDLVDQLFNSAEKRLARTLLLLARYGKESNPEPVVPKISQETLAAMVGTTRSRISHFMNKFRSLGLIDYDLASGRLEVHNALLNVVLHD
jgi:CRP/FNR family cyclic AMP-dependent transcriptional regulator